ncbi:Crp/Fnr family transcriptional regulator [Saccharopolyspora taberi]|uniref:Crp/Fnr family transcriptional regulator n=1 Tax=Saccharopolyspora taberi TaxID=60895 RepID=A0ABN3VMN7_9PSEU
MGSADKGRAALRAIGRPVSFRRSERLIALGDRSEDVVLLLGGLVKAVLSDHRGSVTVTGLFGAGDVVGEVGVLRRCARTADIVGLRPGTAVRVPAADFLRLQEQDRDVRVLLDEAAWKRQRYADDRQLSQTRGLPARVAMFLLGWAKEHGEQRPDGLHMSGLSQRDIAEGVCAAAQSVETVLQELRRDSLLETGRLRYRLPDPAAIESKISG